MSTLDVSKFLRNTPENTARAFFRSPEFKSMMRAIAEDYVPLKHGNDDSFAGSDPKRFVQMWGEAIKSYVTSPDEDWGNVVEAEFDELEMWVEMVSSAMRSIDRDIRNDHYSSTGSEVIEALADLVECQEDFGEHARSNFLDTLGSEIYDALDENEQSLGELIREAIDKKSFLASPHDLVEFTVFLTMRRNEYLDNTYLYLSESILLGHSDGLKALKELFPLVNLSSQAFADALDISDDVRSLIAPLYQADPERPCLLDADALIEVIDNSNGGHFILFGFASAQDLLNIDPSKGIQLSGKPQIGIHDFINRSGHLVGLKEAIVFPPAFLLEHDTGPRGGWKVNDTYDFVPSLIKISIDPVEPSCESSMSMA